MVASQSIAGFEIEDRDGEEGEAEDGHDEVEHGVSLYLKKPVSEEAGQPRWRNARIARMTPATAKNAAMLSANSASARFQPRPWVKLSNRGAPNIGSSGSARTCGKRNTERLHLW
jgi:hypothetical protein